VMAKIPSAETGEERRRMEAVKRVVVVKCILGRVGGRCVKVGRVLFRIFGCSCKDVVEVVIDGA
jgi:hypothetical protein